MKRTSVYNYLIALLIITCLSVYDITPVFLGAQVLVFAYTAFVVVKTKQITVNCSKYIIWGLLFILYTSLSAEWCSIENVTVMSRVVSITQVFLVGLCILIYATDSERINFCLNCMVLAGCVLCIRFFVAVPPSSWGDETRVSYDSFFGKNAPAIILAYASVVLLWRLFYQVKGIKRSILPAALIVIFMFVTMMLGTKKSLMIFAIGFTIMFIAKSNSPAQMLRKVVILLVLMLVCFELIMNVSFLYKSIGYRIAGFLNLFSGGHVDKSTMARKNYALDALKVFTEHPIFGIGLDGYRYVNPYFFAYSHCNFTEMLADLGIIGFGLYYSLHMMLLKKAFDIRRSNILPLVITVITIITDIAAMTYSLEYFYIYFALMLAICNYNRSGSRSEVTLNRQEILAE